MSGCSSAMNRSHSPVTSSTPNHDQQRPAEALDGPGVPAQPPHGTHAAPQGDRDQQEGHAQAERVGEGQDRAASGGGVLADGGQREDGRERRADARRPARPEDHAERERGEQPAAADEPEGAAFAFQPLRPPDAEQEQAERGDQDAAQAAEQSPLGYQDLPECAECPADQGEEGGEAEHEQPGAGDDRTTGRPAALNLASQVGTGEPGHEGEVAGHQRQHARRGEADRAGRDADRGGDHQGAAGHILGPGHEAATPRFRRCRRCATELVGLATVLPPSPCWTAPTPT
jgi:hypothetical protein